MIGLDAHTEVRRSVVHNPKSKHFLANFLACSSQFGHWQSEWRGNVMVADPRAHQSAWSVVTIVPVHPVCKLRHRLLLAEERMNKLAL